MGSTPQSTPSPRSQLLLTPLPQLLPPPQLPMLLTLLPQLLPVLMLLPQLSLLTVTPLLSQLLPSLLKFIPATPLHKYLKVTVIGLWLKCPAETDTIKTRGSTCPCWLLSMLSCRHHKCNVLVMSLQYDPNTSNIKTSGIVIVMALKHLTACAADFRVEVDCHEIPFVQDLVQHLPVDVLYLISDGKHVLRRQPPC